MVPTAAATASQTCATAWHVFQVQAGSSPLLDLYSTVYSYTITNYLSMPTNRSAPRPLCLPSPQLSLPRHIACYYVKTSWQVYTCWTSGTSCFFERNRVIWCVRIRKRGETGGLPRRGVRGVVQRVQCTTQAGRMRGWYRNGTGAASATG